MGLLDKASKLKQTGGLMERANSLKEAEESLLDEAATFEQPASSEYGGNRTGAPATPQSSESHPSGLLKRAESARQNSPSKETKASQPNEGKGLLARARSMREGMRGLFQRAKQMREGSASRAPESAEQFASQTRPAAPVSGEGKSSTSAGEEFRRQPDTETAKHGEPSGTQGFADDFDTNRDLASSADFLPEDEFDTIARQALDREDEFALDSTEPEISSEAMQDYESGAGDFHLPDDDAFSYSDQSFESAEASADSEADKDADDFAFDSDFSDVDQSDLHESDAGAEHPLATDPDTESGSDEFPDLDLTYREPEDSEDPARPTEETVVDSDPFGRWEEEALEEAEQEAHSIQSIDAPPTSRDESFLYEDTHPMTTLPAEAHIASQRKIDHYMALFDLLRELQDTNELEDFWESLGYAILGQLGASKVILFAPHNGGAGQIFYPATAIGIIEKEHWALKPGDEIYDRLLSRSEIHYAQEFRKPTVALSAMEEEILGALDAQVVAPIGHPGQLEGILIIGANMEGVDYSLDDLEYLKLLGEMSAGTLQRIRQRLQREEKSDENARRLDIYQRILSASREAGQVKNLDDLYDVLLSHLKQDFGVRSASLILLNVAEQQYRIFAGNEISPESLEKFRLSVSSELVGTVSNLTRLYDFAGFRQNQEITSSYSNDDLALMQHYWIVPLINLNWLVGFITIHRTEKPWTEFDRELALATAEFFAPVFANCIILGERETLFRDPFSPVVDRLKKELNRAAEFQTPVSLVEVRVKNLKRLLSLNEPESVTAFLLDLSRSIGGLLFDSDFLARVGQGRFALILPGRNSQEADIFVRKIQAEFKRLNLLSHSPVDVQYSFQSVTAPDDAEEAEKMLAYLDP